MSKQLEKQIKSRNVLKNNVFTFVLGGVVFSGVTVGATYLYHSNQVDYEPTNESWKVDNVETALNQLYDIASDDTPNIIFLGNELTYNMSDLGIPENVWRNLTIDNFITAVDKATISGKGGCSTVYGQQVSCVDYNGTYGWGNRYDSCGCNGSNYSKTISVTHTYDATTGILNITISNADATTKPIVYFISGSIKTIENK